ncbi:C-C motif chemokine 4 homolog [Latimeria chalumnae]|uniref:C-C motif chemokine 4 homolog n=1 Tax=Latimeria chalumnae TaxID=7897 RepID=UPI0003C19368|nr:PREDICTED: C-C motif chemokine 4 homolog [Latimeria chalumnae]|eukprot:XP_005986932.1 PREDICTED: C-C motif chemokine 4 homolog [Latimeria chalumnae]
MKVVLLAAVVLVLAAFCFETQATGGTNTPSFCCFSFQTRRIPMRAIEDYFYTNTNCSTPGLVFITKKGRQACVNPEDQWVKDYLNYL